MCIYTQDTFQKLLAFGMVGVVGTGGHYITLILLVEFINLDPVEATTFGFLVGAAINYILNYRYTFKSTKAHLDAFPKFLLIAIATGLLNTTLVYMGIHWAGLNYLLTQIVTTLFVFLVNFALNSIWTYRESHNMPSGSYRKIESR